MEGSPLLRGFGEKYSGGPTFKTVYYMPVILSKFGNRH